GNGKANPSAWYVDDPKMVPVRGEGFVGAVAEGGAVNFRDITFNPHGHGTHTECLGHITHDIHSVDVCFRNIPSLMPCSLVTLTPQEIEGDRVLDEVLLDNVNVTLGEAVAIRTVPNGNDKRTRAWSNTNPPYFSAAFMNRLVQSNVKHLLVDLPSVDKEVDGGRLEAHHAFWRVPDHPRHGCTITELIHVPDSAPDGLYLLNLQVAPMDNDAAISRPVLHPLV
ncbi:MAG: cyclase family protein, partial [Bacteroidota bacterium]|nr:cyclase family protein [Bacteroidota bacterium]